MSKVSNDLNLLLQSFTGKASSSTSKTTHGNSPSVKHDSLKKEYTPTRLQYSTDMKQIKHFELQSEYTEAKQNLESLKKIDPEKRPKSWSLLVSNATKKLKESSTELEDFKKDNPKLETPTKDLGQLLSTLETLKQKAPKSKYVLLTSDLVNEFKDGKYPAPLKVQQLLKDVAKVIKINTTSQSDPNFDSLESILIGFVPSPTPVKPLLDLNKKEYTPTRLQYSRDMKQIKHFELQSEYTEAKQNLESLKKIDPEKRPKSWSRWVSNATKKLKESSTELKDFKKDNPKLETPTKDLGQLLSTLETLKQKAPKSKYVLLTSDLVNEFKDGKYPAPLRVQQLLKDVSKVINTKPQSDPNFDLTHLNLYS